MIQSKRARSERLMKRQHIGDIKEEKKEKKADACGNKNITYYICGFFLNITKDVPIAKRKEQQCRKWKWITNEEIKTNKDKKAVYKDSESLRWLMKRLCTLLATCHRFQLTHTISPQRPPVKSYLFLIMFSIYWGISARPRGKLALLILLFVWKHLHLPGCQASWYKSPPAVLSTFCHI